MITVKQYPVPNTDHFEVLLPRGATVLGAEVYQGQLVIFVLQDTAGPEVARHFCQYTTGQNFSERDPKKLAHVGSTGRQHIFEVKR